MSAMRFAESVARNRSVNIRLFSDIVEAENWILKDRGTETPEASG
jgi:hypothetical protein